MKISFKTC